MSDQLILFILLGVVFGLLVWGKIRYDLVAFSGLVFALVIGVVPEDRAFSGFGHPATVIIALVLIASRGLSNSGAIDLVARQVADVTFRIRGYDSAGNYVANTQDTLTLRVDEMPATGDIASILVPGETDLGGCALLELPSDNGPLNVRLRAVDADGFLAAWSLTAVKGSNETVGLVDGATALPPGESFPGAIVDTRFGKLTLRLNTVPAQGASLQLQIVKSGVPLDLRVVPAEAASTNPASAAKGSEPARLAIGETVFGRFAPTAGGSTATPAGLPAGGFHAKIVAFHTASPAAGTAGNEAVVTGRIVSSPPGGPTSSRSAGSS